MLAEKTVARRLERAQPTRQDADRGSQAPGRAARRGRGRAPPSHPTPIPLLAIPPRAPRAPPPGSPHPRGPAGAQGRSRGPLLAAPSVRNSGARRPRPGAMGFQPPGRPARPTRPGGRAGGGGGGGGTVPAPAGLAGAHKRVGRAPPRADLSFVRATALRDALSITGPRAAPATSAKYPRPPAEPRAGGRSAGRPRGDERVSRNVSQKAQKARCFFTQSAADGGVLARNEIERI